MEEEISENEGNMTLEFIESFIRAKYEPDDVNAILFSSIQSDLRKVVRNRLLNSQERQYITVAIMNRNISNAENQRCKDINRQMIIDRLLIDDHKTCKITIFMTYSDDYLIGKVCEHVNRSYATSKNYEFLSYVLPSDVMLNEISPKSNCTWYKVWMLNKLLQDTKYRHELQFFVWIDADAVVIDHTIRIEDIIEKCNYRELIIAEDMNPSCLMNAGVFIVRSSDWSRKLWSDVWYCKNYDHVAFYEQSALIKCLRSRGEGFSMHQPFHSYLPDAIQGYKLFTNVAVLPNQDLNSNTLWSNLTTKDQDDIILSLQKHNHHGVNSVKNNEYTILGSIIDDNTAMTDLIPSCFIFHPAGLKNKYYALCYVLEKYQIEYPKLEQL